jgi:hypothetical protein
MRAIGSWISGSDQIGEGVSFLSNLNRWLRDERTRTAPAGGGGVAIEESGGAQVGTAARWSMAARRSGAPNMMGKEAKQRGDHGGAHLGQQTGRWVVVLARSDGVAPLGSGDDGGSLRWASSSNRTTGSFAVGSSTFSQPPIAASSGRLMRTKMNSWWLGFGLCEQNSGNTVTYIYRFWPYLEDDLIVMLF